MNWTDLRNGDCLKLMKMLLDAGILHGDCLTVTGNTLAENLKNVEPYDADQNIIMPLDNPIKKDSHLRILRGNLATEGAVAKITGKEGLYFEGPAIVFEGEYEANDGIRNGMVKKGDVVVIRYEGPQGGPGMPEMLKPTAAIIGADQNQAIQLVITSSFVSSDAMSEAVEDGFEASTRGNTEPFAAEIKTFMGFFSEDIVEGDTYNITYQTGKGVVCYKNNKELGSIQGMDFKKALFGIWLGINPADSNLKSGMLGK